MTGYIIVNSVLYAGTILTSTMFFIDIIDLPVFFILFSILISSILIRINIKKKKKFRGLPEVYFENNKTRVEDLYDYHKIMSVMYYHNFK